MYSTVVISLIVEVVVINFEIIIGRSKSAVMSENYYIIVSMNIQELGESVLISSLWGT